MLLQILTIKYILLIHVVRKVQKLSSITLMALSLSNHKIITEHSREQGRKRRLALLVNYLQWVSNYIQFFCMTLTMAQL
jgi:hypothetical protein